MHLSRKLYIVLVTYTLTITSIRHYLVKAFKSIKDSQYDCITNLMWISPTIRIYTLTVSNNLAYLLRIIAKTLKYLKDHMNLYRIYKQVTNFIDKFRMESTLNYKLFNVTY